MKVIGLRIAILFAIPFLISCAADDNGNELTEGNTEVGDATELIPEMPEGWPDLIKYTSYDIPDETDNPEDYIDVELGRWYAARCISGLPRFEAEPIPGYIEAYLFFPKIPENRAYVYVLPRSDTGITSLEEMCARVDEAYAGIEDYVWFEEKEPGFGEWGYHYPEGQKGAEFREEVYEILYGVEWDIKDKRNLYPVFWSASPALRGYYRRDFGQGIPNFFKKYPVAETAAKKILGTDDVTFDTIYLNPPLLVFEGANHKVYFKYEFQQYYYVDDAIDNITVPDAPNGNLSLRSPVPSQNPDGTPAYIDNTKEKWEELDEEFSEAQGY